MDNAIKMVVEDRLSIEEGLKLKMYLDSKSIPTIGYGHNLRDVPISKRAATVILEDDIANAATALVAKLPWVAQLDPARQMVLLDMSFNMGIAGLLTFEHTLFMIKNGEYANAANNLVTSAWARETGNRATQLMEILRTGVIA